MNPSTSIESTACAPENLGQISGRLQKKSKQQVSDNKENCSEFQRPLKSFFSS